jgi:8-oxo-dGDP phosphatase
MDAGTDGGTGEIRQLASREVYRSPWMSVREDDVLFPNGVQGIYSTVVKPDFALVLPYVDGGFWVVEQYRYPVRSRQWEFPLGTWPAGQSGPADELAARELREETGLTAEQWTHLGRLQSNPGVNGNFFDVYLATDLTQLEPQREATESDMVHAWRSEQQLREMTRDGTFVCGHCLAALALWHWHSGR